MSKLDCPTSRETIKWAKILPTYIQFYSEKNLQK